MSEWRKKAQQNKRPILLEYSRLPRETACLWCHRIVVSLQVTLLWFHSTASILILSPHSSIHLIYSAAPGCLRWTRSVWDSTHHERSILWEEHFFLAWGNASHHLRGGIQRPDRGDSLRTFGQARCLNFALRCGGSISILWWKAWLGVTDTGLIFHIHFEPHLADTDAQTASPKLTGHKAPFKVSHLLDITTPCSLPCQMLNLSARSNQVSKD